MKGVCVALAASAALAVVSGALPQHPEVHTVCSSVKFPSRHVPPHLLPCSVC